jgi:hypothetical protein
MPRYRVTFDQRTPLKDGWLVLEAHNPTEGREFCSTHLRHWSGFYNELNKVCIDWDRLFPAGCLGTINIMKVNG